MPTSWLDRLYEAAQRNAGHTIDERLLNLSVQIEELEEKNRLLYLIAKDAIFNGFDFLSKETLDELWKSSVYVDIDEIDEYIIENSHPGGFL